MINGFVLFMILLYAALGLWLLYKDGLIRKPWVAVLCAVLLAAALSARASVFDMQTGDYRDWLARWVSYYRENGGFRAFAELPPYCNYHVPYLYFLALFSYFSIPDLYLIKLLSVLFDVLLAWAVLKLCGRLTANRILRLCVFFVVLFWPTVFLNSAVWGQCDSIYVSLALIGLWLALEDRPALSVCMFAFSFAFKLQAIFVLPILAVLWIYRKYNWKHLLLFPAAYLLLLLPAILLGRPVMETIFFYLNQTGSIGDGLNYNSPSVFAILWNIPAERQAGISRIAICAAGLYLVNLLALAWIKRRQLNDRAILCLALLMTIGIPFLLPHMHDRYFFPADLLSLAVAFGMPPLLLTAPLVEFASFLGYYAYLSFYFSDKGGHFLLYMYYGSYALLAALLLTAIGFAWSTASSAAVRRKSSSGKRKKTS